MQTPASKTESTKVPVFQTKPNSQRSTMGLSMSLTPNSSGTGTGSQQIGVENARFSETSAEAALKANEMIKRLFAVDLEFKPFFGQLASIQLACENWMKESEAPSTNSLDDARAWLARLQANKLKPSRVSASADGGIGVSFKKGDRYCDIECPNSGQWSALFSDGAGSVRCEALGRSFEHQNLMIRKIRGFLQAK